MTTDMAQQGQQPLWQVFKIEDTYGPTSLGGDNRIKRVWFHVLGAADSYVDVAYAQFNAANVAKAVDDHVLHIVDVLQLKGTAY